METLTSEALSAAERFLQLNGRILERRRFGFLFRGDAAGEVRTALAAYRNADGGFGHGLEPDLRGASSQPVPTQHALEMLGEIGATNDPGIGAICDFLSGASGPDGGVPFLLPSVGDEPRAPWWQTDADPPASINPTAALAGLLHAYEIDHPWRGAATDFCWRHVETLTETSPYDARAILSFLDHVPDRERAEKAFAAIRDALRATVETDLTVTEGAPHYPLDFAPTPDGFGRALFDGDLVEAHLDALVRAQRPDGGWTVNWLIWTPVAEPEWRSWVTVERLKTLRAYGRLAT